MKSGYLWLALALTGCMTPTPWTTVYQREGFDAQETFSRLFDADAGTTCEAARRTLLSQGYLPGAVQSDSFSASKSFQPEGEVHVQIVFNVICVAEKGKRPLTTAYVNAIQDRYTLKKNPNSANVGVSALGSLSIPLTASADSLVKVASETIPAGPFYDRFFSLMQRQLSEQSSEE